MGVQVQELTQNLMPWGKEYIDFSFAGKHISEFGLVAVTSGDRYQFAGSPEFEDETSSVNGVWGQYYWGTNYKTKTYSYSLATDGMTERQFEDFKRHFRPGHYGQFYEDTWFDRYCYVRIKAVVDFTFIPFQEQAEIAGVKFESRIYKGECKISFIQDLPFRYSFYQILDTKIEVLSTLTDNGEAAARMMYHSNIPAFDSWVKQDTKCATGSWMSLPLVKKIVQVEKDVDGKIIKRWTEYETGEDTSNIFGHVSSFPYYNPSSIGSECNLEFTINRTTTAVNTTEWEPVYFNEIYDSITNVGTPYNTVGTTKSIIADSSAHTRYDNIFKYGLPEVSADINKAIDVAWRFYQTNVRGALAELQEDLQEELINTKVLLWAIKVLQKIQTNQIMYMPEDYNSEKTLDGLLLDANTIGALSEEEQSSLEKDSESVIGQVIFHSGDYEEEAYIESEDEDVPGCLRPNKVTVDTSMICNLETMDVDWFGYFNIMMLMMFAECDKNVQEDILTSGTFGNFYPYSLKFYGEKGQAFVSYKYNYMSGDGLINQSDILDENCSNIVASNYLVLDGGDTLNVSTGKVASYHMIGFNRGLDETITVDNVRLEYKYTYA